MALLRQLSGPHTLRSVAIHVSIPRFHETHCGMERAGKRCAKMDIPEEVVIACV
ncbi:hypothetical protein J6590_095200 [Homalodisca vitripennis]|nr:hypothetical protein J6590_095200 [Homalodisca vitripennis]